MKKFFLLSILAVATFFNATDAKLLRGECLKSKSINRIIVNHLSLKEGTLPPFPSTSFVDGNGEQIEAIVETNVEGKVTKLVFPNLDNTSLKDLIAEYIHKLSFEPFRFKDKVFPTKFFISLIISGNKINFTFLDRISGIEFHKEYSDEKKKLFRISLPAFKVNKKTRQSSGLVKLDIITDIYGRTKIVSCVESTDEQLKQIALREVKKWIYVPIIISGFPKHIKFTGIFYFNNNHVGIQIQEAKIFEENPFKKLH